MVLKSPKLDGDKLTFDVDVLEGDLNGADGSAAVFIDIIGRPLTPMSFAGVGRRTAYRGRCTRGQPQPVLRQPTVLRPPTEQEHMRRLILAPPAVITLIRLAIRPSTTLVGATT